MELLKIETPELQVIEKSKAEQIKATFEPMVKMLSEFEDSYNEVLKDSENEITRDVTVKAKRLRIDIGKVRIETEKIRKEQKEEFLRAGKAIDGVSNILKWAVTDKENKLKEIENFFEIQEQKRLDELQIERVELLAPFVEDANERQLSNMDRDVWDAYLSAKKKEYNDRIEAEKQAELERIAKEQAEKEEQERIRKENEQLKKDALEKLARNKKRNEELSPYIIFIRDYNSLLDMEESDYKKELSEIKKGAALHWENERIEAEKQEKIEAELKAKADKERKEKERIEAELEAKKQAELKAKEDEEKRLQAELSKGDSAKVKDLINDLEALKTKYSFKSVKNQKMYSQVSELLDKIIGHITK